MELLLVRPLSPALVLIRPPWLQASKRMVYQHPAAGAPMIIALLNPPNTETILAALRAGVHEILFPPLQESLRRALEKRDMQGGPGGCSR